MSVITYHTDQVPDVVKVKGSFDDWKEEHIMELVSLKPHRIYAFNLQLYLPHLLTRLQTDKGYPVQYKFLVDGQWVLDTVDGTKSTEVDSDGNTNHVEYIEVPQIQGESSVSSSEEIFDSVATQQDSEESTYVEKTSTTGKRRLSDGIGKKRGGCVIL